MKLNINQLTQLFEGLSATGVRTILWDKDDNLVYADPGMLKIYQNEEFNEKFGKVELKEGMSWRKWTEQEIMLGIIEVSEDLDQESFLNKMEKERQNIKDRRSRELTFKNGVTVLSTDIRLRDGSLFTSFTDITEQRQKNEKLNTLTEAMDKSSTGIWIFDKNEELVFINEQVKSIASNAGFEPEVGMKYQDYLRLLVKAEIVSMPEGVSEDDFIEQRASQRLGIVDVDITERKTARGTSLLTTTRLEDGGLVTVSSDISELKKSIEKISALSNAMDKSSAGMWVFDKEDKFVFGNAKFHENMAVGGINIEEGLKWSEYIARLINAGIVIPPNGVAKDDFIRERIKVRSLIKDNEVLETETNFATFLLSTNRLDDGGLVTISTDITELRKQEADLQRLRTANDFSSVGTMFWDENDVLLYANKNARDTNNEFGVPVYVGMEYSELARGLVENKVIPVDDGLSAEKMINAMIKSRAAVVFDKNKGNETLTFERVLSDRTYLASHSRLEDGSLFTTYSEITELKKHELELARLNTATDFSSVGTLIWDENDNLIYLNKIANEFMQRGFGFSAEIGIPYEAVARAQIRNNAFEKPSDMSEDQFVEHLKKQRRKFVHDPNKETVASTIERVVGAETYIFSYLRLKDGSLYQTFTDITEQKRRESELQRLSDGIDSISNGLVFWDENQNLVFCNEVATEFSKKQGFDMRPGVNRLDMRKQFIASGMRPGESGEEGLTENKIQKQLMEVGTTEREQIYSDGTVLLFSDKTFPDGSVISVYTDITERKKREETNRRLTDALEQIPNGMSFWDTDGGLIQANKKARNLWKSFGIDLAPGQTRAEMREMMLEKDAVILAEGKSKEQQKAEREKFWQELKSDEVRETEFTNGMTVSFTTTRLTDGSTVVFGTDITERKKREVINNRLNEAIEMIQNGVMFWDKENKLILANQIARDFQSQHGFDLVPGVHRSEMRKAMVAAGLLPKPEVSAEASVEEQRKVLSETGKEIREVTFSNGIVFLFANTMLSDGSVINFFTDITERKQREETNRRLTEALEQIPNGLLFWDKDDNLIGVNRMVKELWNKFGVALDVGQPRSSMRDQFLSNNAIIFASEESKEQRILERKKSWQQIEGQQVRETEFADGTILLFNDTRLKDGSTLSFASNITELKKREKDLELAKIEADEANEAKSQFLANMSHELRTPLNAVIGLTEMLKEDAEEDNLDDYLEPLDRIHNASRHLLTLINDVLDLSKIEAGKIELYFEQFLVSDIMRDIMATSEPLAQKNNNELILRNNLDFDSIHSDQTRVRQIVLNLVSNACKFTENGQVTISLNSRAKGEKEFLDIAITDTGIGMSEAQVNKLFQAFTQADSSTTRKYGGTGLGLIITKHLSRIMGGDVDVSSVEGEGTTFTASITINANNADNVEADAIKYDAVVLGDSDKVSSSKAEHTILIIDDDPTVRDLMKRQLERDGFGVLIAEDGPLGIKMAIEMQPDAVVLDILMPGMDGWSVLRTLKASKETASIPVIMASILDEKNRGFSLGAADYLSKPVERDRLISSIEKLIGSGDGKTVFIIEDDDELRFLLREALLKEAFDVMEAENGKVALQELGAAVGSPDLILLDLNMPVMNGFEFLEIYREKFGNDVPIVVVTGADLTEKDKKFLSGEVARILEKTPDTEGTIAGDVAKVLRNVRMG